MLVNSQKKTVDLLAKTRAERELRCQYWYVFSSSPKIWIAFNFELWCSMSCPTSHSDCLGPSAPAFSCPKKEPSCPFYIESYEFVNGPVSQKHSAPEKHLVINRQTYRGQYFPELLNPTVRLYMMLIPSGTFLMGSSSEELDSYEDEKPQHEVRVQMFFISRTPITQAQWRVVAAYPSIDRALNPDPSNFKGDNHPVERVDWDDATEFCRRLSQKTGHIYRLPSEAEWEYACRAGTKTPFHFGETLSDELANYRANETYGRGVAGKYREQTTEVGIFPANQFGLYDMHGNVWEWCEDHWHSRYDGAPKDSSTWIETDRENTRRILRGGSWNDPPKTCRSAYRNSGSHDYCINEGGFRVCCVPPTALLSA